VNCPGRDDLAAYSIGALEPDEERSVEAHTPGCERCTRELRAFAPAVAVLGESVEQLEPPAGLRERVIGTVREEAERAQAVPARERRSLSRLILRPAAGLAALAVVGAGAAGYAIRDDEDADGPDEVPIESQSGIGGELQVSDDAATLKVSGMPQLAKGSVYQVWVAQEGAVRPASSFVPDQGGMATATVSADLRTGDRVMVTQESRPGRKVPDLPPVLSARID
jgi:anti-sigma-K factor RskA